MLTSPAPTDPLAGPPPASLPRIAITMGDPAGIGPEIIVRAWQHPLLHALCQPLVLGSPLVLQRAADRFAAGLRICEVTDSCHFVSTPDRLACLECVSPEAADVPAARIDPRGGHAAYEALCTAARLALEGRVAAIVTAPLHKAALHAAGHHYPGHTELLAELCGVADYAMMLYLAPGPSIHGPAGLGVIHTTLHMALRDVFAALTTDAILSKIRLADRTLGPLLPADQPRPRLAVCALNPHAGEEGLFGDEELLRIAPAVQQAQHEGIDVAGPLPADTLMMRAAAGQFDGVVAMYHDQGHIALKLLGMHRAVNITLGLPIVRTSVAHGTAFDLAWQGQAQFEGLIEALRVAALVGSRGA